MYLMYELSGMSEKHELKEEYPLKHYRKLRKLVRRKKADVEESAENSFSIDAINNISQDEIVQTDSEEDDTETDGFFLQPVPIKLRRSLLKLSGVKRVDATEKEECKELRGSREECGCSCKTVCKPDTCLCALNGIQCQVDRFSYPCGCSKRGCGNPSGRIEFNPGKVQKHYRHTFTKLEKELQEEHQTQGDESAEKIPAASEAQRKKGKHIRFSDNGEGEEGENGCYNSTESGCCLDCSLTTACTNMSSDAFTDLPSSAPYSLDLSSDELDTTSEAFAFGSISSASSSELSLHFTSLNNHSSNHSRAATTNTLCPISGLLNPILNTEDSLDMYRLQRHAPPSTNPLLHSNEEACDADCDDNALPKWQYLTHESSLTSNSLIPMKEDAVTVEPVSSLDFSSLSRCDNSSSSASITIDDEFVSFTALKPSPLSFQLQSSTSSHNVVHAMGCSELEELNTVEGLPLIAAATAECE